jgi:hypothetical protein
MSVDAGHRREVCALLKSEFSNTQFIITTHDPIWLKHMRAEGLIPGKAAVQFRGWSVDHGPALWDDRDVWEEIDECLQQNDVRSAASLLRHYLEYVSAELCHRLRAPVEFHGDARYQLGELLPAAVSHMRRLFRKAKDAANSWKQQDVVERVGILDAEFSKLLGASNVEQWQINTAVHYNAWDSLTKEDFQPVVRAFRNLLNQFRCPDCQENLRVSPTRGTAETIRCECGGMNINLVKRPREAGPQSSA